MRMSSCRRSERTPGSICKQSTTPRKKMMERNYFLQTEEQTHPGKIIKNSRVQNRSLRSNSTVQVNKNDELFTLIQHEKPDFRLRNIENNYHDRLSSYQQSRKVIADEIISINRMKSKAGKIEAKQNVEFTKKQLALYQRKHRNKVIGINNPLKENRSNEKQKVKLDITTKHKNFFIALERLVRFEERLRQFKLSINSSNKEQVHNRIRQQNYKPKQIASVDFEQYDLQSGTFSKLTPEIIADSIIDMHKKCEKFWKGELKESLDENGAREIFQLLNFNDDGEIDLKTITRELNYHTGKQYKGKDLYRIHKRLHPFTKSHFILYFSKSYY